MDELDISDHDPHWDHLMPFDARTPPPGDFDFLFDASPQNHHDVSEPIRLGRDNTPPSPPHNSGRRSPAQQSEWRSRHHSHSTSTGHPNPPSSSSRLLPAPVPRFTNPPAPPPPESFSVNTDFREASRDPHPHIFHQHDTTERLPPIGTIFRDLSPPPNLDSSPWDAADYESLFGENANLWDNYQDPFDDAHNNDFVDLTASSPVSPEMPTQIRKRHSSRTPPPAPTFPPYKRRRTSATKAEKKDVKVEQLDLVDVDDHSGLSKVLADQQASAIAEQQKALHQDGAGGETGPTKLSGVTCIICMESMTDMTVTHCGIALQTNLPASLVLTGTIIGHLFCHTCIMEALIAGENQSPEHGGSGKGTSKCPVCRKKVQRPKEKGKDKRDIMPLEIKCIKKNSLVKGKGRER